MAKNRQSDDWRESEIKLPTLTGVDQVAIWLAIGAVLIVIAGFFYVTAVPDGDRSLRGLVNSTSTECITNGRIVFQSDRDGGDYDIYTMESDGSDIRRLTFMSSDETEPVWSPDGTTITFTSNGSSIYIMDADGSNQRKVTQDFNGSDPSWSPDGSQIIFRSTRDSQFGDIFMMDVDGTNIVNLTQIDYPASEALYVAEPVWTHDDRIIFIGTTDVFSSAPRYNYYIMGTDGSNHRFFTAGGSDLGPAQLHPDGDSLIFGASIGGAHIFKIDADGTDNASDTLPTTLPPSADVSARHPAWSPLGDKIVFVLITPRSHEIAIMDANGSDIHSLTNESANFNPSWQALTVLC